MIPEWLTDLRERPIIPSRSSRGRKDFLEKALRAIVSVLSESVFSESHAKRSGLMQRIDPRVKLVTIGAFVFTLSTLSSVETMVVAYVLILVLCRFSNISLTFFTKRVWFFVPLFTAAIAFPAIFNFVTPGRPLFVLLRLPEAYSLGPWHVPETVAITEPGLKGALLFTARVAASVSAVILLMLTTLWNDLLRSLRVLRLPAILVTAMGMTYRYVILLLRTVEELHLARKSRTISRIGARENRIWVANRMAYTFRKSMKLSEDVHLAMVSRGFDGEPRVLSRFRIKTRDMVWSAGAVVACAALTFLNLRMGA